MLLAKQKLSIPNANIIFVGDEYDAVFAPVTGFLADSSQSELQDKIVYLGKVGDSFFLSEIQRIQNAGGVAVLYGSSSGNSYFELVVIESFLDSTENKTFLNL